MWSPEYVSCCWLAFPPRTSYSASLQETSLQCIRHLISSCRRSLFEVHGRNRTQKTIKPWTCFNYQLNAQFLYSITICMLHYNLDRFRGLTCPSSGGKFVLSQHLVLSLSVKGYTVCWMRTDCSAVCSHPACRGL
jgi:hypothetical protein